MKCVLEYLTRKEINNFVSTYKVSQDTYDTFMILFKDYNRFHTDEEFAISLGFENKITHGNILCGFLSHFVGSVLNLDRTFIASQNISFHKPVYIGDELILNGKLSDLIESVMAYELKFRFIRNYDSLKVASGKILLKQF